MSNLKALTNLQQFLKIIKNCNIGSKKLPLKHTEPLQSLQDCANVKDSFCTAHKRFPYIQKSFSELLEPDAIFQKFKVEK